MKQWQSVCRDLQREIIAGKYRPRERLVEDDVIADTGATRHAVRKAFDELERLGLVVRQPNRGVAVRDYTAKEVEELYEIRECLETRAADRFPLPAEPSLVERLSELAEQHASASRAERFADLFALNNAFHETLYRASGNAQLADAIRHYTFATHPIRTLSFPDKELREIAISDHRQMIEALEAGDRAGLAAIIRKHISRPKEFYLRAIFVQERF